MRELSSTDKIVLANLKTIQGKRTDTEMAYMIGAKSPTTWRARLTNPRTFRMYELERICERFKMPFAELTGRLLIDDRI